MEISALKNIEWTLTSDKDELLALSYFLWTNDYKATFWINKVFLDYWSYSTFGKRLKSRIFVKEEVLSAIKRHLSMKPHLGIPDGFAAVIAANSTLLYRRGKGEYIADYYVRFDGSILVDLFNLRFIRTTTGELEKTDYAKKSDDSFISWELKEWIFYGKYSTETVLKTLLKCKKGLIAAEKRCSIVE